MPKFPQAMPPNSEVIMAHLFHFKPIFDPPLKKIVRAAPVPGGECTSKTWTFSSACKKFGDAAPVRGRNIIFRNIRLRVGRHEPL